MANKRLLKEKQTLVLMALCEGMPIRAAARMFKVGKNTIHRLICETGEAFADYMDKELRDLPCSRIEMDEQWQYVGCRAGRLPKDDKTERGDYWLWGMHRRGYEACFLTQGWETRLVDRKHVR